MTLNFFLFNKADVDLGERYTEGIISTVSRDLDTPTSTGRQEIISRQYFIHPSIQRRKVVLGNRCICE